MFGDAVVEDDGELQIWVQQPLTEQRLHWYHTRLRPSIEPLAELDVERVLVTHGEPVLEDGADALRAAFAGPGTTARCRATRPGSRRSGSR